MDRQLFKETFSCLHASEDTVTEVLKMAKQQETRKKERHPVRMGILIGLAAVLLVGAAYAAAGTGFIQSVFGAKGQENTAPQEVLEAGKDTTWTMPGREWVEVDEAQAERLIGEHVAAVGESVSLGNWTLTVDAYAIDDHGIGAVTYTLANPTGLGDTIRDAGNGAYYVNGDNVDDLLGEIGLEGTLGDPERNIYHGFDTRNIVDKTLTTDTELHAVMYFTPTYGFEAGESIRITLGRVLRGENGGIIGEETQPYLYAGQPHPVRSALLPRGIHGAHFASGNKF